MLKKGIRWRAGNTIGSWGGIIPMPIIPIAVAALPNGKVLMWSTDMPRGYGPSAFQTYTGLYDPLTGQSSSRLVNNTQHNMVRTRRYTTAEIWVN